MFACKIFLEKQNNTLDVPLNEASLVQIIRMRKPICQRWFNSDTIRAVKPNKMARGLKFRIYEVEGLYFLCGENKDADQLTV